MKDEDALEVGLNIEVAAVLVLARTRGSQDGWERQWYVPAPEERPFLFRDLFDLPDHQQLGPENLIALATWTDSGDAVKIIAPSGDEAADVAPEEIDTLLRLLSEEG
jgi:hypothetical protein